jgi:microcystin-dependent protein
LASILREIELRNWNIIMSEPFVAEIRIFAGNFAIRNWAFCDGQLLPVAQNTALFSLVGTTYGGDGRTTFGLPNLQGRAPMHPGSGPGLTPRRLGEITGAETATLNESQIPSHNHTARGSSNPADSDTPANNVVARGGGRGANSYLNADNDVGATKLLQSTGDGQSHNNMQPYLAMYFIIALQGLYPSRS